MTALKGMFGPPVKVVTIAEMNRAIAERGDTVDRAPQSLEDAPAAVDVRESK